MNSIYRVLIVEDDPMARKLLEIFIQESEQFELAGAIESAAMAIDLILMDVCTAMNANGLDAAEKIKKSYPGIRIVIITSQPEYSFIDRAQAIGIESFWYKSGDAGEILSVMTQTMNGETVYPEAPPVLRLGNALSAELTERELEVLRELTEGASDAEIAEKLHMSIRTVKGHIQSMRDKTGFRNRTELAVRARESGLVIGRKN